MRSLGGVWGLDEVVNTGSGCPPCPHAGPAAALPTGHICFPHLQCRTCGRFIKTTADYTISPSDIVRMLHGCSHAYVLWTWSGQWDMHGRWERRAATSTAALPLHLLLLPASFHPQGRKHPDNDITVINCSRCGCPPEAHEVLAHENERELGNDAFALGQWDAAIQHYSLALQHCGSSDAILCSNRSAAYLAKSWGDQALLDADRALALRPDWGKVGGGWAGGWVTGQPGWQWQRHGLGCRMRAVGFDTWAVGSRWAWIGWSQQRALKQVQVLCTDSPAVPFAAGLGPQRRCTAAPPAAGAGAGRI